MSSKLDNIKERMAELASIGKATAIDDELSNSLLLLLQSHSQTRHRSLCKMRDLAPVFSKKIPYNHKHPLWFWLFSKERPLSVVFENSISSTYPVDCITALIKEASGEFGANMVINHAALTYTDELLSFTLGMRSQYTPRFFMRLFASQEMRFPSEDWFKFIKGIESGLLEIIAQDHKDSCRDETVNLDEFDAIKYATDYYDLIQFYRAQGDEDALNLRLLGGDSMRLAVKDIIESISYSVTRKDAYAQIESRKGALASKTSLRVIESLLIQHKQKLEDIGTTSERINKMHEALALILPKN